ncbi:MAG TPA: VOC family protein [Leptospiraceae bacterium]|nr:VOC family protein [Leptospiraceae bacterium]HNN06276.1 VOC family protein [Leptospiraceae bacterium]
MKAKVILDISEELCDSDLPKEEIHKIADLIREHWEAYLHLDKKKFSGKFSPSFRRMSQRARTIQDGTDAVLSGIQKEWELFERPNNIISDELTVRNLNIYADDKSSPSSAWLYYWIEIEGGSLWEYDDQGLVIQVLAKENGEWKLIHHTDGWSTDYDLDSDECGSEPTFIFDYVYPVKDLGRAVKFYSAILGQPDWITETQAFFGLRDPGFILDSSGLYGYSEIKKDLPNGYAVIYTEDLQKEIKKLKNHDVKFLENTDSEPKKKGNDLSALISDTEGNVIVITERNFSSSKGNSSAVKFSGEGKFVRTAEKIAEAWVKKDSNTIAEFHGKKGLWFDCSRSGIRGVHKGGKEISENLEQFYWKKYDHSDSGISAEWSSENVLEVSLEKFTVLSYERMLKGNGNHPFSEKAFVTHIFNSAGSVLFTCIAGASGSESIGLELDYTGHPVTDLKKAEKFYTEKMRFGKPYKDEDWRGYWSNNTVYGIFTSSLKQDRIPVKERTNGYASFLVISAAEVYEYLKKQGCSFPRIPALNDRPGLEKHPGYIQVVSTDSEGNIIMFTEYSGRKK